ncbi:MAG: glutamate formiminotransferase [Actinomycetota bacterium]|nr:glutamate formiminotransferase [Actinomycetota bacterium]
MSLVAVPNVSEGRDAAFVARLVDSVTAAGTLVADVHSDQVHNRTVITAAAPARRLVDAMAALAEAAAAIDLTVHEGVHPRLGGLDVCPFVVDGVPVAAVVETARSAGAAIAERAGLPVYLYGHAATRRECENLPDLRRGGLARLIERSRSGLPPDFGPAEIAPRRGVVCVGARGVLIAFNVWLRCHAGIARGIARGVRSHPDLSGVRALGLDLGDGRAQVSMNLTQPERTGIDRVFETVAELAAAAGAAVDATELVGVPPERYLPDPDAEAARLLIEPGRSLEAVLARRD